tara:strand:+ start:1478 stop:1609 length:132 start_codon:yes stop_codon:yes gene_type:complete
MEFAMPRKTRMYIPGIPAHIVQRGNNREAFFLVMLIISITKHY